MSPVPPREEPTERTAITATTPATSSPATLPLHKYKYKPPLLRLQLNDLSHDGSSIFLSTIKGAEDAEAQVQTVLNLLYTPASTRPGTRSVTLVLRAMDGLAYTTGLDIDADHKEIHFNLSWLTSTATGTTDPRGEILGVLCHELVHCFQWNAQGTAPGGLVEGVADWVRLRAGLAARHWRREAGARWDAGYQHTGYFLEYLEQRFGAGTVRGINEGLREGVYDEEKVFGGCCGGKKVGELWEEYGEELKRKKECERVGMDGGKSEVGGATDGHGEKMEEVSGDPTREMEVVVKSHEAASEGGEFLAKG